MNARDDPQSLPSGPEPTAEERAAAAAVLQMIWGLHISRAVYAAARLGIADHLAGGPMTAADLARATATHEPSLYRVLRLLAGLGVLAEDRDHAFTLTVLGDRLRADAPASMRSWAMLTDSIGGVKSFGPIVETIRTGTTGMQIAYGSRGFEYFATHPEQASDFQAAMSERTTAFAPSVAAEYGFSSARTVADIGGGKGTLLATILRQHPHLRGVLFDRAEVAAEAPGVLADAGVTDRCEVVVGDFFASVPAGADVYVLANVLHDWDDAESVRILASCRAAMAAGGRVAIVERLIPDDPAAALPVLLSDINMLVLTGGMERTNAEYTALLAHAGLNLGQILPVAAPYGIIEGRGA
jgi:O-methyltransferase domain/Dimerisation domain